MRRRVAAALVALLLSAVAAGAQTGAEPAGPTGTEATAAEAAGTIEVEVEPREATVGQQLAATLRLVLPPQTRLEPAVLGPALGPFSVTDGTWSGPEAADGKQVWTWRGKLAAYRTGDQQLPPIRLTVRRDDGGTATVASQPLTVAIRSVLPPEEADSGEAELADLKPPASVPPDYGPLRAALGVLAALLVVSLVAWWLHRRYAAKLAAAQVPDDPFHRVPPHVWVYGELQRLLEERLPEQGRIVEFYSRLSQILKRYLGGRFRVDLLEQTTEEVPSSLRQAGAPAESIHDAEDLLGEADGVKFAKRQPGPERWKAAVEIVYRIVDRTKPVEAEPATEGSDEERGAA